MYDVAQHTVIPGWQAALVFGLWAAVCLVWIAARLPAAARRKRVFRRNALILLLLCGWFTVTGADKGGVAITQIFRLLFFDPVAQTWPLAQADADLTGAQAAADAALADMAETAEIVTNNAVWTISFDWAAPDRLPHHERQNVLAWTAQVIPTNISDVLYEDHYVCFNAAASTNPAVILIEYAQQTPDGIVRVSSEVVTNSYPDTAVVELQSGSHTCYWFRVAVPPQFAGSVRDWSGEALFGSPDGSGHGFDLLGTLVIDADAEIWVGATTNIVIGGVSNVFANGINVTEGL